MSSISPKQALDIRVVLLDADGVMTDGGLYVFADQDGETEGRRFHAHDGLAIHMLRRADLEVAIVSGKVSMPRLASICPRNSSAVSLGADN